MSILTSIHKGKRVKPRRTVLYGVHGIGKSTFAAKWPKPIFLDLEGGCDHLDVDSVRLKNAIDVFGAIVELGSPDENQYETIVVDSADWLEKMAWEEICRKHGKDSITDVSFGRGYKESAAFFGKLFGAFDVCRDSGKHILLLAHCEPFKHEPPDGESYHRYGPKMHEQVNGLVMEWCDELLFVNYKTFTAEKDEGFNRKRSVALGGEERVIYTCERPGWLAKNRLGLPDQVPFDVDTYFSFIKKGSK
jgi:hypothetical protein